MNSAATQVSRTDLSRLGWSKPDDLLPAIVQHWLTGEVLMLGYMNAEALTQTQATGKVTFYSRSKQRLWMKGESSGHVLVVKAIRVDCDADTLLVLVDPQGPTCHLGTRSCFGDTVQPPLGFLAELDTLVEKRKTLLPEGSYTTRLFEEGTRRIAQKVGEEGMETALAAVAQGEEELLGEAADLIFHLTVLLRARGYGLTDVTRVLVERHR
ncbi:bifunctional phosphoribosyl-AMP cyclohydrolase/phosphoribosyl-ATP diphosphatase HisIE [Dyella sp. M7H15-1]|uniref:bifunctional phosphoribosyl-AMP cyclohydrolase/phosphoribosyl-ATP diphosphatase HisIE n=1 Tax=Dyella sp. M7H15-1 TaxID=2501295 RepID=UPI001004E819|nr:bifunctional phosphoribosyl-AMP cyclohydrolase/phosphoribosyl-ATP diphosphatase HisIE [Dyella sp. M7H15-1]QAU23682.1 bifunctional phosphoribosyl-AMP cyclohydrolase/phosphoribosyl-ATP diphosphatase HisIE [Dyella sp. M7H15-1]